MRPTLTVVLCLAVISGGCGDDTTTTPAPEPPPAPVMTAEPEYTAGTSNTVNWTSGAPMKDSTTYRVQAALDAAFTRIVGDADGIRAPEHRFDGLADGARHHFRVRALDGGGRASAWSAPVVSTQDASPPTTSLTYESDVFTSTLVRISVDAGDAGSGLAALELWAARGDDDLAFHAAVDPGRSEYLSDAGGDLRLGLRAVDAVGNASEPDLAAARVVTLPEPILITDQLGEAWDITNAVLGNGMDPARWDQGIGRDTIRPITDTEHVCEGEPGFPDPDDVFVALALIDDGSESLLIRLNPMYGSEVWNDHFVGEPFSMTY